VPDETRSDGDKLADWLALALLGGAVALVLVTFALLVAKRY
jgi:hypothetical protein